MVTCSVHQIYNIQQDDYRGKKASPLLRNPHHLKLSLAWFPQLFRHWCPHRWAQSPSFPPHTSTCLRKPEHGLLDPCQPQDGGCDEAPFAQKGFVLLKQAGPAESPREPMQRTDEHHGIEQLGHHLASQRKLSWGGGSVGFIWHWGLGPIRLSPVGSTNAASADLPMVTGLGPLGYLVDCDTDPSQVGYNLFPSFLQL